jgi:GAF domain-containing protein
MHVRAARVCGVDDVLLRLHEGDMSVPRAHFGPVRIAHVEVSVDRPEFRWVREHGALHIPDVRAQNEFPAGSAGNFRTYLAAPLRYQGELIGILAARRTEVRPDPGADRLLKPSHQATYRERALFQESKSRWSRLRRVRS